MRSRRCSNSGCRSFCTFLGVPFKAYLIGVRPEGASEGQSWSRGEVWGLVPWVEQPGIEDSCRWSPLPSPGHRRGTVFFGLCPSNPETWKSQRNLDRRSVRPWLNTWYWVTCDVWLEKRRAPSSFNWEARSLGNGVGIVFPSKTVTWKKK